MGHSGSAAMDLAEKLLHMCVRLLCLLVHAGVSDNTYGLNPSTVCQNW